MITDPLAILVVKTCLYGILIVNAVHWTLFGNWIDGWDASLWLVALVMIDLNMFRLARKPRLGL